MLDAACEPLSEGRRLGVYPAEPLGVPVSGFPKMYLRFWAGYPLSWSYSSVMKVPHSFYPYSWGLLIARVFFGP